MMALESGTYISDLVPTNPAGTDVRSQGDDHIRLIKSTLKNTFPNINGSVTATDEQLNAVAGAGVLAFPGMIVMWSGSVASIPSGWKLCNGVGTISTGASVPNLVGRFIVGSSTNSGGTYDVGDTGGASTHTHSVTVQGTVLTEAQMPAHSHLSGTSTKVDITAAYGRVTNPALSSGAERTGTNQGYQAYTEEVGGNQAHTHGTTVGSASSLPPYYALAFLIKN